MVVGPRSFTDSNEGLRYSPAPRENLGSHRSTAINILSQKAGLKKTSASME